MALSVFPHHFKTYYLAADTVFLGFTLPEQNGRIMSTSSMGDTPAWYVLYFINPGVCFPILPKDEILFTMFVFHLRVCCDFGNIKLTKSSFGHIISGHESPMMIDKKSDFSELHPPRVN